MTSRTSFTSEEIKAFEPASKVAIAATVTPEGLPHLTLMTSMMAQSESQMTWGEFSIGLSKQNAERDKKVGWLIMTLDRKLWRGSADWTHKAREGEEYVKYNNQPMFRYNAYFGVNTVHYFDLVRVGDAQALPLGKIIPASLLTMVARGSASTGSKERILKPWATRRFNRLDTLKFLSYVGKDGYPVIVPLLQCQAADSRKLVFSPHAYKEDLAKVPKGAPIAVFCLTMQMESVLTRGVFSGFQRHRGITLGGVDLDYVYNSMPPGHGQIYPDVPLEPVTAF